MKNIFSKRVLSLLLALVITLGMFPMSTLTAFADEINLELSETVLTIGRPVEGKEIYVQYTADGEAEVAAQEKYPVGTDVSEWFSNLPGDISAYIDEYYGDHKIAILLAGVPDFAAPFYNYDLEVPGSFYTGGQTKTFHGNIKVEAMESVCSGCTLKTINGFKVCYKEGKGIHVCELNYGYDADNVGAKWDKSPEDGYISPEEEPSKMDDPSDYWYYFDIEEVVIGRGMEEQVLYLDSFPNLRKVELYDYNPGDYNNYLSAVIRFGERNSNLEIIDLDDQYKSAQKYAIDGLDKVPASAPLQTVEIKGAFVDRGNWNFPTLEKLVLKDCSIAYMNGSYAVKNQIHITGDCAALKRVDLNGTDISGNTAGYPLDIDLENIEYIDISNTGTSMLNIAYYPNLKYLYAENNALATIVGTRGENGKTLADKCPNLVEVDVSGNKLTQFMVGQHTALKKLDLSNNDFTAYSLANVPSIEEFHINQVNEAGTYASKLHTLYVIDCPNLKVLDAGYQMNPNFALALDGLPALKELDLTECHALTDLPMAVKNSVEILKVDNCTNWDIIFSGDEFKNLRVLYAKNVTCPDAGGTKVFGATAPTIEEVYYNGTQGVTHISITSPKLKFFALENCASLTAVDASGASSLQSLYLGKNKNLETLTLDDNFSLEVLDIHVDNPAGTSKITSIDFSDCYSLVKVGVSKDAEKIGILYPDQLDNPDIKMVGWMYKDCYGDWDNGHNEIYFESKYSVTLGDHSCDHYRGQDDDEGDWWWPDCCTVGSNWTWMHFPTQVETTDYAKEYRYRTWNYTQWQIGGSDSEKTAYKADFNFSPYKEDHKIVKSTYYVTALNAEESGIPGLVGWADKKFATEEEILYYPGEQFVLTKDIELYPVYNTEVKIEYQGNSADAVWNEEDVKNSGLVFDKYVQYDVEYKGYIKSSLEDTYQYTLTDVVPTREGYIFKGWRRNISGGSVTYQPGETLTFDETDLYLYAVWEKKVDMPSAYTYLSCDDLYFEKGHSVHLTAKIVDLDGADLSETRFSAILYLYEEGKESEREKVTERTFTGDEVTLTFTYPADDTRIAYVEIYRYEDGYYSQKYITDDYVLTPAKEMDVEFLYNIGDGYVSVTKDTTIVLPQGANDGWLDIEVDAIWGKGDLNIRLYEIYSDVTVGTEIENAVSTNTIGTKSYRAVVTDKTGNSVYTKQLTVKIVPELEVTSTSDDCEIANAQTVSFVIEYNGYNVKTQFTYGNGGTVAGLETKNKAGNERNGYAGKVVFSVPVAAPASGNTAEYTYNAVLTDEFGNRYDYEFHVYFDKTKGLTFAADGRGTLKFYDYYNGADYASVFKAGTDVAATLDGGWIYDIMDSLYASDRNNRPDNVLIPTVGDGVEVSARLVRYESYEAYKNGGEFVNVYEEELGGEYDANGYRDISDLYDESDEYIPGTIDLLWGEVMTPGYYVMDLKVTNDSAVGYYDEGYCFDIKGFEWWTATGSFEILAENQEHVHDYKIDISTGNFDDETPHTHSYKCFCGASYEEDHVYPATEADDLPWLNFKMNGYDTNVERRYCTLCGGGDYRWRFIESFTLSNATLQEGRTQDYEKTMDADQTVDLTPGLKFIEYVDTRVSQNTQDLYNGLASAFSPVNTKINWTSSNQDVAKVDQNGVVTTVGEGTALITGTTVQPGKATGEPMTVTVLISVNCQHTNHMVKVNAKEATCQADGHVEHYMCLDCTKYSLTGDFTDTVSYENDIKIAKVGHAKLFSVWHSDENGHWRECKYECGTRFDEGTHYSTESANCQHPEYCATCNYILAPVTDHSHNNYGWSEGYHWSICECGLVVEGSNEVHQFGADGSSDTCDDCGYKKNVGYTVSGTITSYLKAEGDITVQLLSGEEVAYSQVFNTYTEVNASRKEYSTVYSIPAVVDGTYTLRISKDNHVTRDYSVTVSGGVMTQDAKIHLKGDITGDGQINIMDVNRANLHFKKKITLTDYEFACANVTGDTQVNIMDVNRMNLHFKGKSKLW